MVYESRPKACRDFPRLGSGVRSLGSRLPSVFKRACICPIVYNVLESYKEIDRLPSTLEQLMGLGSYSRRKRLRCRRGMATGLLSFMPALNFHFSTASIAFLIQPQSQRAGDLDLCGEVHASSTTSGKASLYL